MHVLGLTLLFGACLLSLGTLVLGMPGTFLIVAVALLYAWVTGFDPIGWSTIGWLVLLALAGEVIELLSSAAGAGGKRPSRLVGVAALAGAFIGGLLGLPLLFGIGALLGALAGAFAGAALASGYQSGNLGTALSSGWAAMRGRFLGFIAKLAIAAVMVGVLAMAALGSGAAKLP